MNAVAMVRHSGYHQWAAEFTHPCEYCRNKDEPNAKKYEPDAEVKPPN